MAFTYDLTNSSAVSRIRLNIGDTVKNEGILPEGRNLQDEEIALFLQDEQNHPQRATAAALQAASSAWARYAGFYKLGPEAEESRQADAFRAMANELRQVHGYTIDPDAGNVAGFAVQVKVK